MRFYIYIIEIYYTCLKHSYISILETIYIYMYIGTVYLFGFRV